MAPSDTVCPARGLLVVAVGIGAAILLWPTIGVGVGTVLLLGTPLWALNVVLGGRFNDSPLHAFGRVKRFRENPNQFLG